MGRPCDALNHENSSEGAAASDEPIASHLDDSTRPVSEKPEADVTDASVMDDAQGSEFREPDPIKALEERKTNMLDRCDVTWNVVIDQWRPIKEIDGLTVYYEEDVTGGAYMVSTSIRSHPKKILNALTTGSFLQCFGDVNLVRSEGDLEVKILDGRHVTRTVCRMLSCRFCI